MGLCIGMISRIIERLLGVVGDKNWGCAFIYPMTLTRVVVNMCVYSRLS